MKEILLKALDFFGMAFWVEITTESPRCTYYFGPFASKQEAENAQEGYVEDLKNEQAQGISVNIERRKCDYNRLTIFDDLGEMRDLEKIPTLSGQLS